MFSQFNVSSEYLLNPIHLLMLISLVFSLVAYQLKARRSLLIAKMIGDIIFGVYLIILGGFAGGFSALIAVIGGFVQIMTPDEKLEATAKWRIILAIILSMIVIAFSVNRQSDLLPVMAVVYSRFAELASSRQLIALCMFLAGIAWFCYNFSNGFIYAVIYNVITISSMLIGLYRHRKTT